MSLEWNEVKLKDVGKIVTGKTPKTSIEDNYGGHIPFLTPSDDMNVKIIQYTNKTLSLKGLNEVKNCLIPKNSVCVSCIGSDLGKVVLTSEDTVTNQQINSIIVNEDYDYNFIYYTMSLIGKQLNYMSKSSTAVPIINKSTFSKELIHVPPLEEQRKISSILSNIDNLIDNLNKINKNLEEQIETIYNSFFVYYDDYSQEELEECEIGLIPKEWKLLSLGEVTTQIKEKVGDKDYKVFSAVNTGNLILSEEYFDKQVFSKSIEKYIVVKQKEFAYNPARINIGSIGRNDFEYDGCVSPVYVAFKVEEEYENFMNMFIQSDRFKQWVITLASGSVRQTLNYADFSIIKLAYPPIDLIKKFNNIYDNYYEVINYNKSVIHNLEKIRDILLPKLMSGEIDVSKINYDLTLRIMKFILNPLNYINRGINMKTKIISKIQNQMKEYLNPDQYIKLTNSLLNSLQDVDIIDNNNELCEKDNFKLLDLFLSAKQVEGRSPKTITYYKSTIEKMLVKIKKQIYNINTDDLRKYLFDHKNEKQSSKTTIDNIRRILSSFFSWLEDEDYILKNPVRRIHKVKTGRTVKEVLTDENLETLRDKCDEIRDLAMLELLISTGIRVGELVRLNISDIDFYERECVVFGKGESERIVYFDARTKIHLMQYIQQRTDENPALFVSLNKPNTRLGISGIETRLRELGEKCNIKKVHPHKFRRTMATNAIDKGMPIEQVQKLLGHVQIDTTMQYAMVNQSNVKHAHRKFIG